MKRKFMMLFAFLLMTGFGLCWTDGSKKSIKEENPNGMSDVVEETDGNEDNQTVIEDVPVEVTVQKNDQQTANQKAGSVAKPKTPTVNNQNSKVSENNDTKKPTASTNTTVKQPITNQKTETSNKTNSTSSQVTKTPPKQETQPAKTEEQPVKETVQEKPGEPVKNENTTQTTPPKQEEKPVEQTHYNYSVGNCGVLYNSEAEANQAAEAKFNDFSDPDKYVSRYAVYSTYDKWTIDYYYTYY